MTNHLQNLFDESADDATHMVIEAFTWVNLPEGTALDNLMIRINDAIAAVMLEYVK